MGAAAVGGVAAPAIAVGGGVCVGGVCPASAVGAVAILGGGSAAAGLGMAIAAPAVAGAVAVHKIYEEEGDDDPSRDAKKNARTAGFTAGGVTAVALPAGFALCDACFYSTAAFIGFGMPAVGIGMLC